MNKEQLEHHLRELSAQTDTIIFHIEKDDIALAINYLYENNQSSKDFNNYFNVDEVADQLWKDLDFKEKLYMYLFNLNSLRQWMIEEGFISKELNLRFVIEPSISNNLEHIFQFSVWIKSEVIYRSDRVYLGSLDAQVAAKKWVDDFLNKSSLKKPFDN